MTNNLKDLLQEPKVYESDNAKKILASKLANTKRTLQSIGTEVGVSREYVRQVLKYHSIDTTWDSRRGYALPVSCKYCDISISLKYDKKKGCCAICRKEKQWISVRKEVTCPQCKSLFWIRKKDRRVSYASPRDPFCSYSCASHFHDIGNKHGFGSKVFKQD